MPSSVSSINGADAFLWAVSSAYLPISSSARPTRDGVARDADASGMASTT